jgi:hypothetical protein
VNDQVVDYSVGTSGPPLVCALQSEDGQVLNLSVANTTTLRLVSKLTGATTIKSATVVTGSSGVVSVDITSDLTSGPAEWLCRFRVEFTTSGRIVDVPNTGYLRIRVT